MLAEEFADRRLDFGLEGVPPFSRLLDQLEVGFEPDRVDRAMLILCRQSQTISSP